MDTEGLMRRRFFTLDVFTHRRFAGNPPARVCVEAKHASSHWKVEIDNQKGVQFRQVRWS